MGPVIPKFKTDTPNRKFGINNQQKEFAIIIKQNWAVYFNFGENKVIPNPCARAFTVFEIIFFETLFIVFTDSYIKFPNINLPIIFVSVY